MVARPNQTPTTCWRMRGLFVAHQGVEKLAQQVREIGCHEKSRIGQTNFEPEEIIRLLGGIEL